ncbi:hypothetical protein PO909_028507 [Leuciscus waleckii]
MGPYNTPHILAFLDRLHHMVTAGNEMLQMQYTVIWDNVSFHRSALVQNWFQHHPQLTVLYLPPYSPFLNPMEEFFSAWRWKVYDLQPQAQVLLIQAMEDACDQSTPQLCKDGFNIQDGSSRVVLLMRILLVMLMKFSGQIQLGEEIFFFSDYFLCLLLFFTVIVTCTGYSIVRLSVVC